jgi:RND family efflux transporter MFP subunit
VAVPLLAALALAGCKEEVVAEKAPRPVKVLAVAAAPETRTLVYSGAIRARIESPLAFRVPGKITVREVEVGDRIKSGDVIATLDASDLKLQADSARASLAAAQSRAAVTADALKRSRTLFSEAHIAQAALDRSQLDHDEAARAVDAAEAALAQARNQIAYATLNADADGIVTSVAGQPGEVLAAGSPVAVLARDGEKEVVIAIPEQDVGRFSLGDRVDVALFADPANRLEGHIREIAGAASATSRTFPARIAIGAPSQARLGMTATVTATVPNKASGLVVPLAALAERDNQKIVWVADPANSTVEPRPVTLGSVAETGVHVTAGLAPGELVVVAGTQFLQPNLRVKLDPAAVAAAAIRPLALLN